MFQVTKYKMKNRHWTWEFKKQLKKMRDVHMSIPKSQKLKLHHYSHNWVKKKKKILRRQSVSHTSLAIWGKKE